MLIQRSALLGLLFVLFVTFSVPLSNGQQPSNNNNNDKASNADKTASDKSNNADKTASDKSNNAKASPADPKSAAKEKNPNIIDGNSPDVLEQSAFTWPVLAVNFPTWQVVVIPAGNKNSPLNVTWSLGGSVSAPKELTLSYARKANTRQVTNITSTLSGSATTFNWVPPSSIAEARDYFLILSDSSLSASDNGAGIMRPIFSGFFAVYKENDLSRLPEDVPFAAASPLQRPGLGLSFLVFCTIGSYFIL